MTEQAVTKWENLCIEEGIDEKDHKAADNISVTTPVGKFLCTVADSQPVEKTFSKYSCYAAKLRMRIDDVIEIESLIFDENGKAVERNGEQLKKVQPVEGEAKKAANELYKGRFIYDEVNLYHSKEKEAMKNRRIFVAKRIGIIADTAQKLTSQMWAEDVKERKVIVITEWNAWEDSKTKEIKRNVRVAWDGYESAETAVKDDDYDDI